MNYLNYVRKVKIKTEVTFSVLLKLKSRGGVMVSLVVRRARVGVSESAC